MAHAATLTSGTVLSRIERSKPNLRNSHGVCEAQTIKNGSFHSVIRASNIVAIVCALGATSRCARSGAGQPPGARSANGIVGLTCAFPFPK
jgi:hypothetical protein